MIARELRGSHVQGLIDAWSAGHAGRGSRNARMLVRHAVLGGGRLRYFVFVEKNDVQDLLEATRCF